jgi:hypothetical protein
MLSTPLLSKYRTVCLMALIFGLLTQGCSPGPDPSQAATDGSTPAKLPFFTTTPTIKATITRIPSQTPTITPSPVPSGVFALKFYPPLIMNYDPDVWVDKSEYTNTDWMINYLQSISLITCKIGVQGPTDFNGPVTWEEVQIGELKFSIPKFEQTDTSGLMSAMYLENGSLEGYDYIPGIPIPVIISSSEEWTACKAIAEDVLKTLHSPSK